MTALTQTFKRLFSSWAALMLLIVIVTPQPLLAQNVFTDVKLIGNSDKNQINSLKQQYQNQGWTVINKDLNAGAGGDYIYLLYKKENAIDANTYITDFYIQSGSSNPSPTLTYSGRTYRLVSYDGSQLFKNSKGDLNRGAGGAYIHLYYTTELYDRTAVSNVYFNDTKSGAVGENGGTSGYDLNKGCGEETDFIYMHVDKTDILPLSGSGTENDPYIVSTTNEWYAFAKRVELDIDANKYYRLTNASVKAMRPVGSQDHPFKGVFDGAGESLNVSLEGSETGLAPFGYIDGAMIKNLNTYGTVNAGDFYASGLVGVCGSGSPNYIINCESSVTVNATVFGGGLVGNAESGTLIIHYCTFSGSISGFSSLAGGLIGWCKNLTLDMNNCLFRGEFVPTPEAVYHPIICKDGSSTVSASVCRGFYLNTVAPTAGLGNNAVPGASGSPVSISSVPNSFDVPVVCADNQTLYAPSCYSAKLYKSFRFDNGLEGWTVTNGDASTGLESSAVNSNFKCFKFNNCNHDQYLISPAFSAASPVRVRFLFKGTSDSKVGFQVGYSTSSNNTSAFTWLDKVSVTVSRWGFVSFDIPSSAKYVAFKCLGETSNLYIDDVTIEEPYPNPFNFRAEDLTESGITLSWDAPDPEVVNYSWKYRKADSSSWIESETTTDTSVALSGLQPNTGYVFSVEANYLNDRASNYVTCQFTTLRQSATLPHFQTFEGGMKGWEVTYGASGTGISEEARREGLNGFLFNPSNEYQLLQSPLFDGTTSMNMTFFAKNPDKSNPAEINLAFADGVSEDNTVILGPYSISRGDWTEYIVNIPKGYRFAFIIWRSGGKLYVDDIYFFETVKVDFTKEGYATYYDSMHNIIMPHGMKARIVTGVDDSGKVIYNTIADGYVFSLESWKAEEGVDATTINSGTPVLLQIDESDEPQSRYILLDNPTTPFSDTNLLQGNDTETITFGGDCYYRLKYSQYGTDLGWYWESNGGSAFTSNPHEAWLALPSSMAKSRLYMPLPIFDDPTSIKALPAKENSVEIMFDLSGKRLDKAQKGINIINGKKILINK